MPRQLELLTNALTNSPDNSRALSQLADLATRDWDGAEAANGASQRSQAPFASPGPMFIPGLLPAAKRLSTFFAPMDNALRRCLAEARHALSQVLPSSASNETLEIPYTAKTV